MSTGKGKKRLKGLPALHDEIKNIHRIMLTPTAWKKLQDVAVNNETSVSELIENWARTLEGK